MRNPDGSILYCPQCGDARFCVQTTAEGVITWIMCLACGTDSDVKDGIIQNWRRTDDY